VLVAGPAVTVPGPVGAFGAAVQRGCAELGAHVSHCSPGALDEEAADGAVASAVAETGRIDVLAVDGAGLFAHALAQGGDAKEALSACTGACWNVTRAVVNLAYLPRGGGGRIVYLAPAPDGDRAEIAQHAAAARAGLENLARTLSIEWARHGITTVAIAPGTGTTAGEAAALTAYLASVAGAYFSGALLDLRGP